MGDRVELAFRRAADRLTSPGDGIVAAVSGGGDSVALLRLLVRSSEPRRQRIVVAHLDHALRRGSPTDRRFVECLARELGVPCASERIDVRAHAHRSESLEAAARRVRRAFLDRARRDHGCAVVALGHTRDDQAETVLMRLLRGAGPTALTGMVPSGPGPFVRPLLDLDRADLRRWLERRNHAYREDPSNRDLRFDRNRLRAKILPVLTEHANPRAADHLVRAAALLREDAEYLDTLARGRFRRWRDRGSRGAFSIPAKRLVRVPEALAGRVARVALDAVGVDARRVSTRHVRAVLDLAAGPGGKSVDLPGGARVALRGGRLRFRPGRGHTESG